MSSLSASQNLAHPRVPSPRIPSSAERLVLFILCIPMLTLSSFNKEYSSIPANHLCQFMRQEGLQRPLVLVSPPMSLFRLDMQDLHVVELVSQVTELV